MRKLFIYLLLSMTLVSCNTSNKRTETLSQEDKDAITELRNNVVIAIKSGDAESYGDLAYEVGTQSLEIDPPMKGFNSSRKYVIINVLAIIGKFQFD